MIGENDYATVSCICRASDHPDQGSRDFFLFQGKFLHIIGSSAAHRSRHWSMLQKLLLSGTRSLLCWLFFSDRLHRHREIQVRNNTAKRNKNKRAKGGRVWKSGIRSPTFFLVLCFFFSLLVVSKRIVGSLSTYSSYSRNRAIRVGRRHVGKSIFLHWCSSDGSHYSCLPQKKYTAYRSRTKAGSAVFQTSFFSLSSLTKAYCDGITFYPYFPRLSLRKYRWRATTKISAEFDDRGEREAAPELVWSCFM